MTKKTKVPVSQEDFEAELQSTPKVFDVVTLGISPKEGGGFNIIKVLVTSKGLEAGNVEVLDTAEDKFEAIEKFKINVVKQGVL